ncbi:MAG: hypothetical protein FJW19_01820 [Actinobacteria bacterium]|nr:hypothetical protein [Actinomycetota bacterium]
MTIVWNAQCVSEGLEKIDEARPKVLAKVKQMLDAYHRTEKSPRYYDILLGDWVERYLHLVYVAVQKHSVDSKIQVGGVDAEEKLEITPSRDLAEFFSAHQTLPDLVLATLQTISLHGPGSLKILGGEATIKNSNESNRLDLLIASLMRVLAPGSTPKIVFVKPFSGRTPGSWRSAMWSWRKWARQDDMGFGFSVRAKIDTQWRSNNLSGFSTHGHLGEVANAMLSAFLPVCLVEGLDQIKSQMLSHRATRPAHVYSAQSLWTHLAFKVLVAQWCEDGSKLHYHQHGGWYGLDESHVAEKYESRVADYYYTWGWSRGSTNTISLPPVLPALKRSGASQDSLICFDQPKEIYRLQYFPLPGTIQTMYEQTAEFVKTRRSETNLVVRLFPGDFGQAQRQAITAAGAATSFDNSTPIFEQYGSSRIVFHNYLGTSWLETMGLDIPTICFYDVDAYRFRSDAKSLLEDLVEAGILHLSGESAADHANSIENDVAKWWLRDDVQTAKRNFTRQYANFSQDWKSAWETNFARFLIR